MNWAEYLVAKKNLNISEQLEVLDMQGVAGDNGTRYLQIQKGEEFPNDANIFDSPSIDPPTDFIWNGTVVRAHTGFSTGGHPALAGFQPVYCAGVIEKGYFRFHSGHYKPKQQHVLPFIANFIENSCQELNGTARDAKVDELSAINLVIYRKNSTERFDTTTFGKLAVNANADLLPTTSSAPMAIGARSSPLSLSAPKASASSSPPTLTEGVIYEKDGLNSYGRHQLQLRKDGAPPWIDVSAAIKCNECKKAFGKLRWKHHCRRCGYLVCDNCSKTRQEVAHPAVKPGSKPATGKVRVCDSCKSRRDLDV